MNKISNLKTLLRFRKMATDLSVQAKQSAALARMLCGSSSLGDDEQMIGEWRVLVYDRAGRDILLPLFSVAKLKNMGITVILRENNFKKSFQILLSSIFSFTRTVSLYRMRRAFTLSSQVTTT